MYEVWIVLFCFFRSVVMKLFFSKKGSLPQHETQASNKKSTVEKQTKTESTVNESPLKLQLRELQERRQEIQSTMEQFNTPSTFAKYSKMQRELTKLCNQISALQIDLQKQNQTQQSSDSSTNAQPNDQNGRETLLEQKKKQMKAVHSQIANKELLVKALINLGLIVLCSYVESSELSVCAGYPAYTFCNERGKINGAWIFIFSSVIFNH